MPNEQIAADRRNLRYKVLRFLVWIHVPPLLVIPLIHVAFKNPDPGDLAGRAIAARCTGNMAEEKNALAKLIQAEPLNTKHHYRYINVSFDEMEGADTREEQTRALCFEYRQRTWERDPKISNIGHFGLGLCHLRQKQYNWAMESLLNVSDPNIPGLNYLLGRTNTELRQYLEAERCFREEIRKGSFLLPSVTDLAHLLYDQQEWGKLHELCRDPATRPHVPTHLLRIQSLHERDSRGYLGAFARSISQNVSCPGLIGGILITVVWLAFLKRLDVFEPEKDRYLAIALAGGMSASLLAPVLYDLLEHYLNFSMTDAWIGNLVYCIFGIGLVEEIVKAVPLLLMIRLSRQFNESIDYLIYASVSALGFALVENIFYFNESCLFLIEGRGLICVIGHMFYTALVAYGIILARYRHRGTVAGNVLLLLLLAAVLHGLYDFWLSLPFPWGLLAVTQTVLAVVVYNHMVNNALNQSEFFDPRDLPRLHHRREKLGVSLVAIVLVEYIILAWKYGPELTQMHFFRMLTITSFFVFFLSFGLSIFVPLRRHWISPISDFRRKYILMNRDWFRLLGQRRSR